MYKRLLYNGEIVNEGSCYHGYVEILGERIKRVGRGEPSEDTMKGYTVDEIENLEGAYLMPGVIDDQVHFREPGLTHKADIESESRAAVSGGVTSFMDMPNTKPQTVSQEAWKEKMAIACEKSFANYSFFVGATNENIDELKELDYRYIPGIKVFLGASTGNMLVNNEETLEKIFALPHLIAIHSEDEEIIRQNMESVKRKYVGKQIPIFEHPNVRSREACVKSTKRAIERAERCGTRLHILHLSTRDEAEMLKSERLTDKQITGEVCVHHMWFSDADYTILGSRIKWNPAVKTADDRKALRLALRDGKIDIVATDHAPHLLSEKGEDLLSAASGGPLIQFSLQAMLEIALQEKWSVAFVVDKMCHAPATLFKIRERGFIREGYFADLVVVDKKAYTVVKEKVLSKCGWTPFEGTTFRYTIRSTYVNGTKVWDGVRVDAKPSGHAIEYVV